MLPRTTDDIFKAWGKYNEALLNDTDDIKILRSSNCDVVP